MKWILIIIMASQLSTIEFVDRGACERAKKSMGSMRAGTKSIECYGKVCVEEKGPLPIQYIECVANEEPELITDVTPDKRNLTEIECDDLIRDKELPVWEREASNTGRMLDSNEALEAEMKEPIVFWTKEIDLHTSTCQR